MTGSETVERRGASDAAREPCRARRRGPRRRLDGRPLRRRALVHDAVDRAGRDGLRADRRVALVGGDARASAGCRRRTTASSRPALVGAPLAALDLADGIRWAQLLQALAASLVAVPTYRWARRLGSARWADRCRGADARGARAALRGLPDDGAADVDRRHGRAPRARTRGRGAVDVAVRGLRGWATAAAAVRLQALVLLPAFLLAVALDALAARDRSRLRPLAWLAAAAALVAARGRRALSSCAAASSRRRACSAPTRRSARAPARPSTRQPRRDRLARVRRRDARARDPRARDRGARVRRLRPAATAIPALRAFVSVTLAYVPAGRAGRALLGRVRRARRGALPDHGAAPAGDRALRVDRPRRAARARRRDPRVACARRGRGAHPDGADRRARRRSSTHSTPSALEGALGRPGPRRARRRSARRRRPRRRCFRGGWHGRRRSVVGVGARARLGRRGAAHRRRVGARGSGR